MRFYLLTLGCAKNVADSDGIGAVLKQAGMDSADDAQDADVMIVNTCGFLQASRQESITALRDLANLKRDGQMLIAAGCLVSRYEGTVRQEVPQVDAVIDAGRWLAMPRLIDHLRSHPPTEDWLAEAYVGLASNQIAVRSVVESLPRSPQGPSAYLKIADGCDRPCTFCIIPAIKGGHRSKSMDAVLGEARDLVAHGVKEIVLVAQDTTAYGWDWGQRDALAPLLERLCEIQGLEWLRLMYAYPGHVTPRLIETMAHLPQIVHYIDVPLQHAHPETLKRMKRPNMVVTRQMLDALRQAMPDLAIRTTFIVGFPGETNSEFQALLEFLEEQQFDRVGIFEYSREEGTPSATLPKQISAKTKKHRRKMAMELQQRISLAKNRRWTGREIQVLVEGAGDGVSVGRSYRDAPEVDGTVIVKREMPVGGFVRVEVTKASEYDLWAEPV